MSLTWVVIAIVIVALIVFGLLLFLTDITGHHEPHGGHGGEAGGEGGPEGPDPSKISSEFLSSEYRKEHPKSGPEG